jgi:hypothetical protein
MTRAVLGACALLVLLAAGTRLWPTLAPVACTASTSGLPPPGLDARPAGSAPELPRLRVEVPVAASAGLVRVVVGGEDLQGAIEAARPGDILALEPGAVFTGPIRLPKKTGDEWITIRTNVPDGPLPPPGTRVGPSQAPLMAKIESASDSAITASPGAHHYRFIGIEVRPRPGAFLYNLVTLGTRERSLDDLPHHIVFERCYLHGDPEVGGRRGIAANSRHTAVVDSYLSDFKESGADSQAILGWNGLGPIAIVNNYLEAAGENVMFGGGDPAITNLVPSDIEVRGNHFAKPLSWKQGEAGYRNTSWTVKNLFELKNARRVLIDGNVFENNWLEAQVGFAIQFTVRNQEGGAPWSVVEDVTFSNNIVRHAGSGINILGHDDNWPSQPTRRITIRNNVFDDVGGARWGSDGRLFQVLAQAADVVIDHNTAFHTGNIIMADQGPLAGFVYRNNITPHNDYGIIGTGTGVGSRTLSAYFPDAVVRRNVIAGGQAALYPEDNFFPASLAQVGFMDLARGDYRLSPNSPYRRAGTDGKDLGADFTELSGAMLGSARSAAAATARSMIVSPLLPAPPVHPPGLRPTSRIEDASRSRRSVHRTAVGCTGGVAIRSMSVPAGKPVSTWMISKPAAWTRAT